DGTFGLLQWLWTQRRLQANRDLFFNFSTPRALLLFLMVPKVVGTRWILMLHHGDLSAPGLVLRQIVRLMLSRFDRIQSLSEKQAIFYRSSGVSKKRIVAASSYCEPAD